MAATFGLAVFNPNGELADQIKEAYEKDESAQEGLREARTERPDKDDITPTSKEPRFTLNADGLLLLNGRIYIPDDRDIRMKILAEHHDSPSAGHPGRDKTLELIGRNFHFPNGKKYVKRYVATCDTYARAKPA